ncbi:MAG: hypothetical protein HDQ88_11060 [Clostridia bacterium]|nr:hypothetical protein [Clostridia bacterium]
MTPLGLVHDGTITWDHDMDSWCLHVERNGKTDTWSYNLLKRRDRVGDWEPVETKHGFMGQDVVDTGMDREVGHGFMGALMSMDFRTGLAVRRKTGIDYCALN